MRLSVRARPRASATALSSHRVQLGERAAKMQGGRLLLMFHAEGHVLGVDGGPAGRRSSPRTV